MRYLILSTASDKPGFVALTDSNGSYTKDITKARVYSSWHEAITATRAAETPIEYPNESVNGICPNCEQWVNTYGNDCVNECRKRGLTTL